MNEALQRNTLFEYGIAFTSLLAALTFLVFSAGDTVHWRDSAEFILAATYLDIPHPPGFASYGSFANLLTFIPLGPLTWRVHLFGVLVTVGCLFLVLLIAKEALKESKVAPITLILSTVFALIPLFFSPAFLRQATTAEAYQLNSLFILLILWCGARYERLKDCRYIFLGGFLAGIGLGNHPALLLFALPGFLLFLPSLGVTNTFVATCFALIGLGILAYLPVRANQHPPLNTGEAVSFERFVHLITDARDRHLRPHAITTIGHLDTSSIEEQIRISKEDAEKITAETGWYIAPFGLVGLFILSLLLPLRFAALCFIAIGSTLFFFRGWQPDPMTPAFLVLSMLGLITLQKVIQPKNNILQVIVGMFLASLLFFQFQQNKAEIHAQRNHELPDRAGRDLLYSLPYGSVFITESSWYMARSLQTVEGVREDLALTYSPQFLFPDYFRPARFRVQSTPYISNTKTGMERAPSRKELGRFLSIATKAVPVLFEPTEVTNTMLLNASSVTPSGLLQIGAPLPVTDFPEQLIKLGRTIQKLPPSYLRRDASSYLETRAIPMADYLFLRTEQPDLSISGLQQACGSPKEVVCSNATHLKQAEYAFKAGDIQRAVRIAEELEEMRGKVPLASLFLKQVKEASKRESH